MPSHVLAHRRIRRARPERRKHPGERASGTVGAALVALVALPLAACHTLVFELRPGAAEPAVRVRHSFFAFGLAPARALDARPHCPRGVAAVREETTIADGLVGLATLGLWTRRTAELRCAPAAPVSP